MKLSVTAFLLLSALAFGQQPNTTGASLFFGGAGGPPYPINATVNGASVQMDVGGAPTQPFVLFAANSGLLNAGVINDPALGRVDLNLSQGFTVAIDGIAPRNFFDAFARISRTGFASYAFPVLNPGVVGAFQAVVLDPTAASGARLTAASRVTVVQNQLFDLFGQDDTVNQVPLTFGNTNFYGFAYTEIFVSANGNVTLGGADGDFLPSLQSFDVGFPRIAPLWADFVPATQLGGQTYIGTFVEDVTGWTFTWTQMANYLQPNGTTVTPTGGNTFSVTYAYTATNNQNPTGFADAIIFNYTAGNTTFTPAIPGGLTVDWGLVGIGPGGTNPTAPANPATSSPLDPAPVTFNPLTDPNGVGGLGLSPIGPLTSYSANYPTPGGFPRATYSATGRVIAFYPIGVATDYVLF